MKRTFFTVAGFVVTLAIAGCARLSDNEKVGIESAIGRLTVEFISAAQRQDVDAMMARVDSSDFTAFVSDGTVIGTRNEFRAQIEQGFAMVAQQEMEMDQRGLQITVIGPNGAAATGIGRMTASDTAGHTMEGNQAFTLVWQKKDGEWRIVQSHFSTRVLSLD